MPNHVVLASGAVVAVSVAVATAIAIYESPELRRYADDVRRRIAVALHSMGDNFNPDQHREPMFNRPEDADGFLESRHGQDLGVEADEETRRRQREELMYWNSVRLAKQEREEKEMGKSIQLESRPAIAQGSPGSPSGSSFDDFLRQDEGAERGTYVFNTGADIRGNDQGLRNRADPSRSFIPASYSNPFADEYLIGPREIDEMEASQNLAPTRDEMSDIYSATTRDNEDEAPVTMPDPSPATTTTLFDAHAPPPPSQSSATLERDLGENEFVTAGQEDRDEAYASIQAWAQNSSSNFYSPLPSTPVAPVSEPDMVSDGQLTPTDSISIDRKSVV